MTLEKFRAKEEVREGKKQIINMGLRVGKAIPSFP